MRYSTFAIIALAAPLTIGAQPLATRIARVDGLAQVVFASRPGACGDGKSFTGNLLRPNRRVVNSNSRAEWERQTCIPGPVRVVATVTNGEVTRIRSYIGPLPLPDGRVTDLGVVPVRDATAWLLTLVSTGPARVANAAMDPLIAAEGSEPWPELLAVARDDRRPRETRREATFWLGEATNRHLGIDDADERASDADEIKQEAVFAISQLPRDVGIPKLLDLARTSTNAPVRKQAVFWLGQSGDARATALFAELLGLR